MLGDARIKQLRRFEQGMADARISRSQLRSTVIFSLRSTQHDLYMDASDTTEEFRVIKHAIVNKNPDMYYVQDAFDLLSESEDILPFIVLFTVSGLPRPLLINDYIIIAGRIYVVSKVRPTNRDLGGVVEALVYPMRDVEGMVDPLAIYGFRFRDGLVEVPFPNIYGDPLVMDVIYGGIPQQMSYDGSTWEPFVWQKRVLLKDETQLYIMDGAQRVASLKFGDTYSIEVEDKPQSTIKYL